MQNNYKKTRVWCLKIQVPEDKTVKQTVPIESQAFILYINSSKHLPYFRGAIWFRRES